MKKIIILLVFLIGHSSFSQTKVDTNSDFWVSYRLDYKKFKTSESTLSENAILIVKDKGSLFTFEAMINLDKIQQVRKLTVADVLLYKSPFYYLIKSDGNSITHYEAIGNDLFKFEEKLNPNWKLINQDTLISGYNCKKAVINYSGREWTAWYTTEIPIAFGPYKFQGLPGLIMKISDNEGVFNFTVNEIRTGNFAIDSKVTNYFVNNEEKDRQTIEPIKSEEFYAIRTKFYQMSVDEKIQYMNRGEIGGGAYKLIATNTNGEKLNTNRTPKPVNFIERYE